jgi:hypothetical protein
VRSDERKEEIATEVTEDTERIHRGEVIVPLRPLLFKFESDQTAMDAKDRKGKVLLDPLCDLCALGGSVANFFD